MTKPGMIHKISIKDFVTYSDVEMYPGPNLNIVIGPNGTGKSTIVAAIILGLGGTVKTIGRGSKISEYIKHDCSESIITIELNDLQPNKMCIVTRKFNLNNHTTWLLNNKSVSEQEVKNVVTKLNIQVNNLCQFLPQDRVQDFAKLDKKELLVNTEKAVGRQDLVDKHAELIKIKNETATISKQIETLTEKLNQTKDEVVRLEGKVKNLQEKKKIKHEIDCIKRKISWETYYKVLKTKESVEDDRNQAQKLVDIHTRKIKPIGDKIKSLQDSVKVTQNRLLESRNNVTNLVHKAKKLLERAESSDNSHRDVIVEMRSKLQALPEFQNEIDSMKAIIDKLKNDENSLLNQYGEASALDQQVDKLRNAAEMYLSKSYEIEEKHVNAASALNKAEIQVSVLQDKLQAMENVKEKRMQMILRRDRDTYEAVQWLRQNKNQFRGNIYEPIMMEINVLDPKNAKYLENVIPFRDAVAFTCEYQDDMNLFLRTVRDSLNLKVNVVHSGPEHPPLSSYKSGMPIAYLRKYGFFSYMNSLITGPEAIVKYLCKMYNLHNIPIGDETTNSMAGSVPNTIKLFFSNTSRYFISSSAYTGEKSTRISGINSDGTFSVSVDVQGMNQIRHQLEELSENSKRIRAHVQELQSQKQSYQDKREEILRERGNILQLREQIKVLKSKRIDEQNKLERHMRNHETAEQIKEHATNKIQNLIRNSIKIHKLLVESVKELDKEIQNEKTLNLELSISHDKITSFENKIDDLRAAYRESLATFNEINAVYNATLQDEREALRAAKKLSEGFAPTDKGFDKFRAKHESLSDDLDELNSIVTEMQTKIDCILTADDGELKHYEQGQKVISQCQDELIIKERKMQEWNSKIEKLHKEWIEPLQEVVGQINRNFSSYFQSMRCSGEVSLSFDQPSDYASYGLSIRVTYRTADPLQELNRHVQSGGERAVATAVYMLSLQDLTAAPFRCVDEINQGMDPQNERRIFEILVQVAGRKDTGQYFLITPKLIAALEFGEAMHVHIVHNGPFCDTGKDLRFNDILKKSR